MSVVERSRAWTWVPATGHDRGVSGRERASSRRLSSAAAICGVAGILTIGVGGAIGAVPGVMSIARAREDRTRLLYPVAATCFSIGIALAWSLSIEAFLWDMHLHPGAGGAIPRPARPRSWRPRHPAHGIARHAARRQADPAGGRPPEAAPAPAALSARHAVATDAPGPANRAPRLTCDRGRGARSRASSRRRVRCGNVPTSGTGTPSEQPEPRVPSRCHAPAQAAPTREAGGTTPGLSAAVRCVSPARRPPRSPRAPRR